MVHLTAEAGSNVAPGNDAARKMDPIENDKALAVTAELTQRNGEVHAEYKTRRAEV